MIDCINQSRRKASFGLIQDHFYSPAGSLDLLLILGYMTSDFLYLSFSTLLSSSSWRTGTTFFAKLNKPFLKYAPASNMFKIDKLPGA